MTIERPATPAVTLHLILCVVALILGVLIFANVIHVQPHQSTGLIVSVVAILLAL